MGRTINRCFWLLGASIAALVAPANAQTATSAEADGEIVVTALKREQRVQDVPLSVQAFSGANLEEAGITDALTLERVTPSFTAFRGSNATNTRFNIRGIGAVGNTAVDQSVAFFVDGVYAPRPSSIATTLLDVAGVEVVRGPQGTLFGRNTTAGGVIIRTADPRDFFSTEVSAKGGSFGEREIEGILNIPASEQVRFRLAARASALDGYGENIATGREFGDQDLVSVRFGIGLEFSSALSMVTKFDYQHLTGNGQTANELVGTTLGSAQRTAFAARLGGLLPDTTDPFDSRVNHLTGGDLDDRQFGVANTLTWDLANGYALRLISGYRDYDNRQFDEDTNQVPVPIAARNTALSSDNLSHELQFISPPIERGGRRVSYVAGLYYFEESLAIDERFSLTSNFCNLAGATPAARAACAAGVLQDATDFDFTQDTTSAAVFGQADIALTDRWTLQLGARHTADEKSGSVLQSVRNPLAVAIRAPESAQLVLEDEQLTYRAGLFFAPSDDFLLFTSFSTGYKSGGFNSGGTAQALGATRRTFRPEDANNTEFGVKSQWMDGTLTANVTFYLTELDGFQDRSFDGTSFVTRNAGSLRHQGFEFDGAFDVNEQVRLNAALAYLDSEFTDYRNGSAFPGCGPTSPALSVCGPIGSNRTIRDLTGARAHFAPEWQASLYGRYEGNLPGEFQYAVSGGLAYTAERFVGGVVDNNPGVLQEATTLWNARLELFAPGDRWAIALYGENLSDVGYCTNAFYQPSDQLFGVRDPLTGQTAVRCNAGAPRTWSVRATARF